MADGTSETKAVFYMRAPNEFKKNSIKAKFSVTFFELMSNWMLQKRVTCRHHLLFLSFSPTVGIMNVAVFRTTRSSARFLVWIQ